MVLPYLIRFFTFRVSNTLVGLTPVRVRELFMNRMHSDQFLDRPHQCFSNGKQKFWIANMFITSRHYISIILTLKTLYWNKTHFMGLCNKHVRLIQPRKSRSVETTRQRLLPNKSSSFDIPPVFLVLTTSFYASPSVNRCIIDCRYPIHMPLV